MKKERAYVGNSQMEKTFKRWGRVCARTVKWLLSHTVTQGTVYKPCPEETRGHLKQEWGLKGDRDPSCHEGPCSHRLVQ